MVDSTEQGADHVVESRTALVRFAQTRPLTLFFLLTYGWTWTLWLGVGSLMPDNKAESYGELLVITGAFGPTVAALITRWLAHRDLKICRVWPGWGSLATGLAFGLGAFFIVTVLTPSAAIAKAPVYALHWSSLLHWSTYAFNYSTLLGGPVPEEPGWRGFALPRLQERYGPVAATLILAPLWAGWRLPLFQVKGWSSANPWKFLLVLTGVSFLLTATANISKFNVFVAIVLHSFFNTSSGLGNALTNGLPRRSHEMMIYTFVVFIGGVVVGLAVLWVHAGTTLRPSVISER
jgi:membrane protease YdiL (CAAX protease family)